MSKEVRTRFAPAPSGMIHLGNVRTALFNWLFARRHGGKFILRIDDTDKTRSSEEALRGILEGFRWLGLLWDEGPEVGGPHAPYFQSQRGAVYSAYARRVMESGEGYYCYCTPAELEVERQRARAQKLAYVYGGRCRNLSDAERRKFEMEGRRPVVRIRSGEGKVVVDDIIKGPIEFDRALLNDEIVVRSNGTVVYNFASMVDDAEMGITHVIRADEHLPNTPKQIIFYKALGIDPPRFAHVPMVLAPGGGKKLSKREGALSLGYYREEGYLPAALRNYLARLGWSMDDRAEIFTDEELISSFSLERVGAHPAALDPQKLLWVNSEYIRKLDIGSRTEAVLPYLREARLVGETLSDGKRAWVEAVVVALGDRLKTFKSILDYAGFLFVDEVEYDPKAVRTCLLRPGLADLLRAVRTEFAALDDFSIENIEGAVRGTAARFGRPPADAIHALRVALTGRTVGPGLFDVVALLGRERTLARLDKVLPRLSSGEWA